jgi:hypothetical protein
LDVDQLLKEGRTIIIEYLAEREVEIVLHRL